MVHQFSAEPLSEHQLREVLRVVNECSRDERHNYRVMLQGELKHAESYLRELERGISNPNSCSIAVITSKIEAWNRALKLLAICWPTLQLMTTLTRALVFTRAWRYEGYEGGIEDSLILVDGEQIGGVYHCSYSPAERCGWGYQDGDATGESWASYGPRGYSFGHATREAAEEIQLREYATDPDRFDRLNAEYRAEREAEEQARVAERETRIAELEERDRRRRLGDDEPGPTVWTLPAYHVLYAPMGEVEAVSKWFEAHDLHEVDCAHEIRVEQRATRTVIVYETPTAEAAFIQALAHRRSKSTKTHVVTLVVEPPEITTPARPDLHELLEEHWPSRFPLIDFGARTVCGLCTQKASATVAADMVLWPCSAVADAIGKVP